MKYCPLERPGLLKITGREILGSVPRYLRGQRDSGLVRRFEIVIILIFFNIKSFSRRLSHKRSKEFREGIAGIAPGKGTARPSRGDPERGDREGFWGFWGFLGGILGFFNLPGNSFSLGKRGIKRGKAENPR